MCERSTSAWSVVGGRSVVSQPCPLTSRGSVCLQDLSYAHPNTRRPSTQTRRPEVLTVGRTRFHTGPSADTGEHTYQCSVTRLLVLRKSLSCRCACSGFMRFQHSALSPPQERCNADANQGNQVAIEMTPPSAASQTELRPDSLRPQ